MLHIKKIVSHLAMIILMFSVQPLIAQENCKPPFSDGPQDDIKLIDTVQTDTQWAFLFEYTNTSSSPVCDASNGQFYAGLWLTFRNVQNGISSSSCYGGINAARYHTLTSAGSFPSEKVPYPNRDPRKHYINKIEPDQTLKLDGVVSFSDPEMSTFVNCEKFWEGEEEVLAYLEPILFTDDCAGYTKEDFEGRVSGEPKQPNLKARLLGASNNCVGPVRLKRPNITYVEEPRGSAGSLPIFHFRAL